MDTWPEASLMIVWTRKNGETRSGPFSRSTLWFSSMEPSPPIPEPIYVPARSDWRSAAGAPESSPARAAAADAEGGNEPDARDDDPAFGKAIPSHGSNDPRPSAAGGIISRAPRYSRWPCGPWAAFRPGRREYPARTRPPGP